MLSFSGVSISFTFVVVSRSDLGNDVRMSCRFRYLIEIILDSNFGFNWLGLFCFV